MKLWIKISLLITILASLIGGILGTLYKIESERTLLVEHNHWTAGLSQALSSAILKDVIQKKHRNVKEVLNRVKKDNPSISYLILTGFDGEPVASTLDNLPEELLSNRLHHEGNKKVLIKNEWVTDISRPLVKNLEAHLHIGINQQLIEQSIKETEKKIIFTTLALTIFAIIFGIIFSLQISRPIEQLATSLKEFGRGKKAKTLNISKTNIEVQNLYKSFEDMASERQAYENELKFYRQELEEIVKQRTKELENEISLHKETEESLKLAKNEADNANKAKSNFLSQMSHEFRTPLNAILGFSQLIEMNEEISDEMSGYIKIIKNSGDHLLQLINEILDLAKIESGKLDVSIEPVSWREVINECIEFISPSAEQLSIDIDYREADQNHPLIDADRVRVKQITLNLLSNAVKYNKKNGKIILSLQNLENGNLKLSIQDTGMGIPDKSQRHLFEPFNRLNVSGTSIEGTGIGLLITKRLTEVMHGQIGFESKEGVGSTFWVQLPISDKLQEKAAHDESVSSQKQLTEDACKRKLLLIEDNPVNVRLVEAVLNKIGNYEVTSCQVPDEGIKAAGTISPDIVLLDINLPGKNGYEVKKYLDDIPELNDTPIIAFSANAMQKDIDKAMNAGFSDYLTKPIKIPEFVALLNKYLDKKN